MENQSSVNQHASSEQEKEQNEFGIHPMSQSGFSGSGEPPSLPPPPLNLSGGGDGPIQRFGGPNLDPGSDYEPPAQQTQPPAPKPPTPPPASPPNNDGGGGQNPSPGQESGASQSESSEQETPDVQTGQFPPGHPYFEPSPKPAAPNADFHFFGVNIPKIAPSLTLAPIPENHLFRIRPAVSILQINQSVLKDDTGVVKNEIKLADEADAAAAIPDNEGRKAVAETTIENKDTNKTAAPDDATIKGEIQSFITTFGKDKSKTEKFFESEAGAHKEMAPVKTKANEGILGESSTLETDMKLKDSYANNETSTPLEDNVKEAETTDNINLAEGAWPETIEENSDFSGILEVVDTQAAAIMAEENGSDQASMGIEELKASTEYLELTAMVGETTSAGLSLALDASVASMGDEMTTSESDRKGEMEAIRTEKLTEVNTQQELAKASIEVKKNDVANVINRLFDEAKTFVDTTLGKAKGILSGAEGTTYTGADILGAPNGYDEAMNWAVTQFHEEGDSLFGDIIGAFLGWLLGDVVKNAYNKAFHDAKPKFTLRMDQLVEHYAGVIDDAITDCNEKISSTKTDIDDVLEAEADLTEDEKANLRAPLHQLQEDVATEGQGLTTDLEEKKEEKVTEVDEYIASVLANPLKQLALDILSLIGEGAEWLLVKFLQAAGVSDAEVVVATIGEYLSDIGKILADPGRFIRTLAEVVGETFIEYFQDFGDNMRQIFMEWLTDDKDLAFPAENTISEWTKFGFGLAGFDVGEGDGSLTSIFTSKLPTQIQLPGDLLIPGEVTVDISSSINALMTGGFSAMWEDLKGQLSNIPIVDGFESEQEGGLSGEELNSPEDILSEFNELGWEGILAKISELGVADGLSPAELEETQAIFAELQELNFAALFQRVSGDLDIDLENPGKWLWDEFKDWVKTDLVEQIPGILIQFAGGGIGKIASAIYKGIRWMMDNGSQLFKLFGDIFKILPMVAQGNKEGAKTLLTSSVNTALSLVLDFVTSVGIGINVGGKVQKVIDKVKSSFEKAINKMVAKIQAAIEKFVNSVKKAMGKSRKKPKDRPANEKDQPRKIADHPKTRYSVVPAKGATIKNAISGLRTDINAKIKEDNYNTQIDDVTDVSYKMDSANADNNDIKTYQVLQGLKHAYELDNQYAQDTGPDAITLNEAENVALEIFRLHKVFTKFKAIREPNSNKTSGTNQNVTSGQGANATEDPNYLMWEWAASPQKRKRRGEEESESRSHTQMEYGSGDGLGVQIFMEEAGDKIRNVQVSGRPPKTFKGSMGDHTTAFIIQVEGVKRVTKGLTLAGALTGETGIKELVKKMKELPGWDLLDTLETENPAHFNKWNESNTEMNGLLESTTGSNLTPDQLASNLQKLISAYLDTRELVPLSTFDIRSKSGSGGKGKAEGSSIKVLRAFEDGSETNTERVKLAIENLFDTKSSLLVMIESDQLLRNDMAPGTSTSDEISLLDNTWNQHLSSVVVSFPKSADVVANFNMREYYQFPTSEGGENLTDEQRNAALAEIKKGGKFEPMVIAAYDDLLSNGRTAEYRIHLFDSRIPSTQGDMGSGTKWRTNQEHYDRWVDDKGPEIIRDLDNEKDIIETLAEPSSEEDPSPYFTAQPARKVFASLQLEWVRGIRAFDKAIIASTLIKEFSQTEDDPRFALLGGIEEELVSKKEAVNNRFINTFSRAGNPDNVEVEDRQSASRKYDDSEKQYKAIKSPENANQTNVASGEYSDPEITAMEQFRNDFGFQIILGNNGIISEVYSSGRTMSPFTGTMGAHSIAWTMHVTHAKSLVLGRTIPEAFDSIATELWKFAKDLEEGRSTTGDKSYLKTNRETIENTVKVQCRKLGDERTLFLLQELVGNILAFINLIPGSSKKGDHANKGRGEGTAKGRLQKYESDMWRRVGNLTSVGPKSTSESEMMDQIREVYITDNDNSNLKSKALDLLEKGVEKLRETKSSGLIDIQYEILETTFPWTYYTLQAAKVEFSSHKKLGSIPSNEDGSNKSAKTDTD